MPKRLKIPPELLNLNPNLNIKEIRAIIQVVLQSRANILRQANVVDIKIPGLGRIKSHGNKKKRGYKKLLAKDRRRKHKEKLKKELTRDKLLF